MNHIVNQLKYEDFLNILPRVIIEQINECDIEEKTIRLMFIQPLFFLLKGFQCLSVTSHLFPINIRRDGYLSYEYKDFQLEVVITNEELNEFYKIFSVSIQDYGFAIDPDIGLEQRINDSSLELNVEQIIKLQPEIKLSGYFKGHGYDFSVAEQYECFVKVRIYGVKRTEQSILPPWKLKIIDAFIIYEYHDYETVVQRLHTAFEMFLKHTYTELSHVRMPSDMKFNKVFTEILEKKRLWEQIIKDQKKLYNNIKKLRDNNMHELDEETRKQIAEEFAYKVITFIYSIQNGINMFTRPWIKGIEAKVLFD